MQTARVEAVVGCIGTWPLPNWDRRMGAEDGWEDVTAVGGGVGVCVGGTGGREGSIDSVGTDSSIRETREASLFCQKAKGMLQLQAAPVRAPAWTAEKAAKSGV